ncbi:MAG: radical SAM protein, partial [Thermodesulfovibrionales bacterium]|nr:radical SAM protein [Thermodesulfovibrionales bacterium]
MNKREDVVCERAFFPTDEDLDEHLRTKTPIFSIESKLPIDRFNIIAFSLSFENDYPNILRILKISNIPSFATERENHHPLVIAGGTCMFYNPEPVASIFDIIFIGEAEETINEFIDLVHSITKIGISNKYSVGASFKENLKREALSISGLYIPQYYEIRYGQDSTISERIPLMKAPQYISRRFIKDLNDSQISHAIISSETEFSDMHLVEIMRGCKWKCRFCVVSHVYSPPRQKLPERVIDQIDNLHTKVRVGLVGPSLSDYIDIESILKKEGIDFSITSLRANRKSIKLIELLRHQRSVSIAPEAGTERLRRVINKNISEKDILEISELILSAEIEFLRLYFMIGLPTENIDDI